MLRNKKGVTLVVLIIAIIIMFIIFGITMSSGSDLLKNSDKNRTMSNLYLIRARADSLLEDYLFDGTDNLGSKITNSDQITSVGFTYTADESQYIYRSWNSDKLKEQGISTDNVDSSETFVIEYDIVNDIVDVASTKGFKDGDSTIYKLSELEEN